MASKRKATHKKKTTKKITKHKHQKNQKHQKHTSLKSTSVDKLMELLRDASAGLARSKSMQRETHIHKLADIMHRIPVPDSEFSLNVNMTPSGKSSRSSKKSKSTHILSHKHDNRNTKVNKNFASYYKMESSMSYDDNGKRIMGVETTTNSMDPFVHIKQFNSAKKGNNKVMHVDVPKSSSAIHTNNLH